MGLIFFIIIIIILIQPIFLNCCFGGHLIWVSTEEYALSIIRRSRDVPLSVPFKVDILLSASVTSYIWRNSVLVTWSLRAAPNMNRFTALCADWSLLTDVLVSFSVSAP